jgi:hypothetical protein
MPEIGSRSRRSRISILVDGTGVRCTLQAQISLSQSVNQCS